MKLSNISKSRTSILSEEEGLKGIDNGAMSELEGAPDLDSKLDLELGAESTPEAEVSDYNPKKNQLNKPNGSGYTLNNVTEQLDGIVKNWFQFAVDMQPDAKEKFLALGERLSEISDIVKEEFSNA